MIGLSIRLAVSGGREALVRVVVTTVAVAFGVGLLLASLASMNAVNKQDARGAWLNQQPATAPPPPGGASPSKSASKTDALWWSSTSDEFAARPITVIDVAATGPDAPVPPGLSRLPRPGEYFASPALAHLLRVTPRAELANRYPGREAGVIGSAGVPNPDSLIVVIGYLPQQLGGDPEAFQITTISESNPSNAEQYLVVLAVAALSLLFPVLVFIGAATRLSAARREQRFAALRLVGATPRQVSTIAVVEATISAVAGVALGFALFGVIRPALQHVTMVGEPFAPGDLSLSALDVVLIAVGVPFAAAAAARIALRRVVRSPLGVRSRVAPNPPRSMRLVPLAAGLIWMSALAIVHHSDGKGIVYADFIGTLAMMLGLVIAGPWLTSLGARFASKRTKRTDVLLAGRRLADNPRAAFRSISGLVLALFVTSATIGVVSTIVADHGAPAGGAVAVGTLTEMFGNPNATSIEGENSISTVPGPLLRDLRSINGVVGVTEVYWDPTDGSLDHMTDLARGLVSCAALASTPALGKCPRRATVAAMEPFSGQGNGFTKPNDLAGQSWPPASIGLTALRALPVEEIAIGTNGSTAAIEEARTDLEAQLPYQSFGQGPMTLGETMSATAQTRSELGNVANVIIAASLLIAGCSLAVGVTAGVSDRKRPFSLLRLTGVPITMLRRVVALEAAVPLVVAAILAAGVGLLGAELFLRSTLRVSLRWPGLLYFVVVITGVVASLGVILSTLPVIDRITGPAVARSE